MGAITLEASLRRRLLLLVAPVTLAVGLGAVAVTSHMLNVSDRDAARSRGRELLLQLDAELAEGDAPGKAAMEVLQDRDDSSRALIRGGLLGPGHSSGQRLPPRLLALRAGTCELADDDEGHAWLGCAVSRNEYDAVVALSVEAHRKITTSLAEWMLAIVALATLGAILAARFAVRSPLVALSRLVQWSEDVASGVGRPTPDAADIVEFERLTEALEALVKHLVDALDRERTTSAHIAHELRTPLTTLRAELELLESSGTEQARGLLGDVDQLAQVIDSILVLSSSLASSGREAVVNLADLARDLASNGTEIDAPEEALVSGDARLVELALRNLLENAKKYSGSPARVVRITREGSGIRVAVIDDGPGLEEEARSRMFDRHWRGPGGIGTGLGLALVRAVAERHGGSVEAHPNAGARGLEVSMTFGRFVDWHSPDASASASDDVNTTSG